MESRQQRQTKPPSESDAALHSNGPGRSPKLPHESTTPPCRTKRDKNGATTSDTTLQPLVCFTNFTIAASTASG